MSCPPISRLELQEGYDDLRADFRSSVGALIIGRDYRTVADAAFSTYTGAAISAAPFPGLVAGGTVDTNSVDVTADALLLYFTDPSGAPTIANGRRPGATTNQIEHNAGATVWTGASFTPALTVAVAENDYIHLNDGVSTFETRVRGFAANNTVLVLYDDIPSTFGTYFNVRLAARETVEIAASGVTVTGTTIAIDAGLTATSDRTGATPRSLISGTYQGVALSALFVAYRAFVPGTPVVRTVQTDSELAAIVGTRYTDPAAELGFAVWQALAPDQARPVPVKFLAVAGATPADFVTAITSVRVRDDYATLLVLEDDASVRAELLSTLLYREGAGLHTNTFITQEVVDRVTILAYGAATVSIAANGTTVTRDGGISDPFAAVNSGDFVHVYSSPTVFATYTVATKVSNQTVELSTPVPGAPLTLRNISIERDTTVDDKIAALASVASGTANKQVNIVFPDRPLYKEAPVPGFLLAAAVGALRGFAAPQQSLKGVLLEAGWSGVPQSSSEFAGRLEELAAHGIFVVDSPVVSTGVFVLYPYSTDTSENMTRFEVLNTNVNAVKRRLASSVCRFVGTYRSTDIAIADIRAAIQAEMQLITNATKVSPFGPWATNMRIESIERNSVLTDQIDVTVSAVIGGVILKISVATSLTLG